VFNIVQKEKKIREILNVVMKRL